MKKLYIFNPKQSCHFYDEAWVANGQIIEHIGKIGTRGRTRMHEFDPALSEEENINRVLAPAVRGGYRQIAREEHLYLLVEFALDSWGTTDDLGKRHRLEDRLNETLGWTGLGHCDGGSIGSGTMEACCLVVDFETAKHAVAADLAGTEFGDYTRIYSQGRD